VLDAPELPLRVDTLLGAMAFVNGMGGMLGYDLRLVMEWLFFKKDGESIKEREVWKARKRDDVKVREAERDICMEVHGPRMCLS